MSASEEAQSIYANDAFTEEKQGARAFLRERFLKCISRLVGIQCQLTTVENTVVSGEFQGMDNNAQQILVKNLITPVGELKFALLRAVDIVDINMENVNVKVK